METRSEYRCGRKQVKGDRALDGDSGIKRFPTAGTDVGTQDTHLCAARRSSARRCARQHATLSDAISHPFMSSTRNGCNRAYCIQIKCRTLKRNLFRGLNCRLKAGDVLIKPLLINISQLSAFQPPFS